MPRPKGLPKTGGRARGTGNKINRQKEIQKAAEASGQLPLDYMLQVMRDEEATHERRDEMARAAAPYLHARRAPEDASGRAGLIGCWQIDCYDPERERDKKRISASEKDGEKDGENEPGENKG
jgi:hypothetical protein